MSYKFFTACIFYLFISLYLKHQWFTFVGILEFAASENEAQIGKLAWKVWMPKSRMLNLAT